MICGTMTLPYLFRIHLFGVGAKVEDSIISGLVTRQGGKSARTNRYETIKFPISFTTIFSIIGQALTSYVLAGSDSNFGIKTDFTTTQFTTSMYDNGNYYAGFHWIAIGI